MDHVPCVDAMVASSRRCITSCTASNRQTIQDTLALSCTSLPTASRFFELGGVDIVLRVVKDESWKLRKLGFQCLCLACSTAPGVLVEHGCPVFAGLLTRPGKEDPVNPWSRVQLRYLLLLSQLDSAFRKIRAGTLALLVLGLCRFLVVPGDMCNVVIYLLHRLEEDAPHSVANHSSYRQAMESTLRDIASDSCSSTLSRQHLFSLGLLRPISRLPFRSWLTKHALTDGFALEDVFVDALVRGSQYLLDCRVQSAGFRTSSCVKVPADFNLPGFAQFLCLEEIAFGVLLGLQQCDLEALSKLRTEARSVLLKFILVFVSNPIGIAALHRLRPAFVTELNESPHSMLRVVWVAEHASDRGVCNSALDILCDMLNHRCSQQHVQVALLAKIVPRLCCLSRKQPGGCTQVPRIFYKLLSEGRGPVLEELQRSGVLTRRALSLLLLHGSEPKTTIPFQQLVRRTLDEPLAMLAIEIIVDIGFPGEFCPEFVSQLAPPAV
mmetsp:Transcript_36097/g.94510  ORF Transcript_36097/g.94510 Transcript_36097/m.94510 type:complete len:495 (+) Transcript_36097:68-1552(+)